MIRYSTFGIDISNDVSDADNAESERLYDEENLKLTEKLKGVKGVIDAYYTPVLYTWIRPAIGQYTYEIPLIEKEKVPVLMKHFDAELINGRLPENEGEIVLDTASMKNNNYVLNGFFNSDAYEKEFKIVGELKCDTYFGCGIPYFNNKYNKAIVVLSDGSIEYMSSVLSDFGIKVREDNDYIMDYKNGQEEMEEEVVSEIEKGTKYIYPGIMLLLFFSVFIVYTMYIRDRHSEWCLYCSIGYSRKSVYFEVLRELLFTFVTALFIGIAFAGIMTAVLDIVMIQPLGVRCRYFYPQTIFEIICYYILLLGLLQIPVRYAIYKICTIDAMDDDMI